MGTVKPSEQRQFRPEAVKMARATHFLTQEDLARELDVTVRTIVRWESGFEPSFRHVRKLAKFFAVSPGDFYAVDEAAA